MGEIEQRVAEIRAGVIRNLARNAKVADFHRPLAQGQRASISSGTARHERLILVGRLRGMAADVDADGLQMNAADAGSLAKMQGVVVVGREIVAQAISCRIEIHRVSPCHDF